MLKSILIELGLNPHDRDLFLNSNDESGHFVSDEVNNARS